MASGSSSEGECGSKRESRIKNPRFKQTENNLLIQLCLQYKQILFKSGHGAAAKKKRLWQKISNDVSALGFHKRQSRECQKRWYDIRTAIKNKHFSLNMRLKNAGEEAAWSPLTSIEKAICSTFDVSGEEISRGVSIAEPKKAKQIFIPSSHLSLHENEETVKNQSDDSNESFAACTTDLHVEYVQIDSEAQTTMPRKDKEDDELLNQQQTTSMTVSSEWDLSTHETKPNLEAFGEITSDQLTNPAEKLTSMQAGLIKEIQDVKELITVHSSAQNAHLETIACQLTRIANIMDKRSISTNKATQT
ncbi:uncharacterized protein LOC117419675 [Acipenser ruthenus]|uniref:uncharacterized protein LOC117419675 n=1 Tax=Acipenser ruthenus TaxID=7906 RepID=UPI00145BC0E6|nr:uncharacterized protein LOC117419675 [Acipenser ruthenus]XP_033888558.1 uncharacterized protein LOC117419675 [Acipenser ruthenus]